MNLIFNILNESWQLLLDAAIYILFGIVIGGVLKVFLSPSYVARHLGQGRYSSVLKAALLGIPLPLCSCGVLPAAAALKKQGANNGATTAFLISTPESGIDSISVSYALLDPIMTVARPLAAFLSAIIAGFIENTCNPPRPQLAMAADLSCAVDGCCSGTDCPPAEHADHHTFSEKIRAGMDYAFGELWGDLAGWFFAGLLLAGMISALVPEDLITTYLAGGFVTMLLMLAFGIPLYICATASTPIAAAMILKGVSPGAALVFLLVGPATNMATISVLVGLLGKRATMLYLGCIAVTAVLFGLALDSIYAASGISAKAVIGQAGELMPSPVRLTAALVILALSVRPMLKTIRRRLRKRTDGAGNGCGCSGGCEDKTERNNHKD
ncbi:MAG: SO_0444 family Cu/Zn efflux transporter [Desulfobulbaceae bacterium]|nr:SO_0444 family Cu/Zn efflux transporter [Desulfobulbaceae bacterium]HIJ90474.1 SO_0444 family Cu/Zn efflux transporter [Deltaproteobacteria bacterium]